MINLKLPLSFLLLFFFLYEQIMLTEAIACLSAAGTPLQTFCSVVFGSYAALCTKIQALN